MKKIACAVLTTIFSLSLVSTQVMAAPAGSMLVGTVVDSAGKPVPGVRVVARDPSGKVVGEAITNNQGQYTIQNLPSGKYQLVLDPLKTPYKGETFLVAHGAEGTTVNFAVSPTSPALASFVPGTGSAATPNPLVGLGLITAGIAVPLVTYYGFIDKDDRRRPASPSF